MAIIPIFMVLQGSLKNLSVPRFTIAFGTKRNLTVSEKPLLYSRVQIQMHFVSRSRIRVNVTWLLCQLQLAFHNYSHFLHSFITVELKCLSCSGYMPFFPPCLKDFDIQNASISLASPKIQIWSCNSQSKWSGETKAPVLWNNLIHAHLLSWRERCSWLLCPYQFLSTYILTSQRNNLHIF